MLTDVTLKNLKPNGKPEKVADRDGMYVYVFTEGAISFRFDYRMHGRRGTLTIGRYGPSGLSLARAREKCLDARRALAEGRSPAQEKQRDKRRLSANQASTSAMFQTTHRGLRANRRGSSLRCSIS